MAAWLLANLSKELPGSLEVHPKFRIAWGVQQLRDGALLKPRWFKTINTRVCIQGRKHIYIYNSCKLQLMKFSVHQRQLAAFFQSGRRCALWFSILQPLAVTWKLFASNLVTSGCQVAAKWLQVAAQASGCQVAASDFFLCPENAVISPSCVEKTRISSMLFREETPFSPDIVWRRDIFRGFSRAGGEEISIFSTG